MDYICGTVPPSLLTMSGIPSIGDPQAVVLNTRSRAFPAFNWPITSSYVEYAVRAALGSFSKKKNKVSNTTSNDTNN